MTEYASKVYFPYFFGQPNVRYCIFVGCMLTGYATRMVSAVYIQRICISRQNRINTSTIVGVGVGVIRHTCKNLRWKNRAHQDPVLPRSSRFDRSSDRCDEKVDKRSSDDPGPAVILPFCLLFSPTNKRATSPSPAIVCH